MELHKVIRTITNEVEIEKIKETSEFEDLENFFKETLERNDIKFD